MAEAIRLDIPVIAMVDTNVDPINISDPIPANDDATKSIEYITQIIAEAVIEGKNNPKITSPNLTPKKSAEKNGVSHSIKA